MDFSKTMIVLILNRFIFVLLAIQSSGVITGLSANSGTVSCGGLICRSITGIFTRNPLPEDAYVHVATIPAGASNISITELKNSINLLVLRTTSTEQKYLFNGDNTESSNGAYDAAGAVFDYRRIDGLQDGEGVTEWITCTGPIREMLELMVYSRDVNPGIKYEYLLPIGSDSEENEVSVESDMNMKSGNEADAVPGRPTRKRKFNWKVVGFSPCSKSCGGGTQIPVIRCARENPTRYFSQRRCSHSEKPVLNENLLRCNTQPCPAFWRLEEWGDCKCQQGEGIRQREIGCVQELATGIVIQVNNVACLEEEPQTKKPCDCPKMSRRRNHHRHRLYNGRLQNPLSGNLTVPNNQKVIVADKDKAGIWLFSDWNNHCSASCGPGIEYRSIYCDRSKSNTERCDFRFTPDTTRPCENEIECVMGEWFAGPWSNCTGSCFNLTKSRQVLCIQNQLIVDNEDCKAELKPESTQKCSLGDVEYCSAKWHYSEWSECTKSCDGGTQRRSVKCLEVNETENTLTESIKCRYSKREPIYRSCNTFACSEPRVDLIQNDIAPTCIDEFNDCHLAVKAKLCSYEYYQQNCCYSCGAVPA
ncbi:thrombospondin type-1 domain-containing protein 4 isoform X2 [Eupeodes corollae]|uniref:thrombospondin type-1 domain-containing protein 4 isoform X2 n=1 Tax=Eupeodes corollae TaxID=290404 RepID=UPI002490DE9C|nr:thrombospondin type-1 domain-containing protein 4 isoform X2 [Eupeodes corollae]XP_055923559.1 thrombospondin type-1 domain-containing protein 4 isoform X2 [Eupeodes corollae]XP_055923560.1 thrombospondin type-1 domain-containing protein 4 isoform X2 [Eupeodes corollae]